MMWELMRGNIFNVTTRVSHGSILWLWLLQKQLYDINNVCEKLMVNGFWGLCVSRSHFTNGNEELIRIKLLILPIALSLSGSII
ncbi:hypothetical protein PRUPE_5G118900 [Prunus persica]|uniref:Uncharacterized protein n=1 Tax=Prunus persica TaxID=3760 RepID=A0A251P756_PRUPE|nr:hypothetical protein PRUPE_5G118900 [Prunus persica]